MSTEPLPSQNEETERSDEVPPSTRFPFPLYTAAILFCIAAVCGVQVYFDPPENIGILDLLLSQFEKTAVAAGFVKSDLLERGEIWRLFTGFATHGFILHAVINSYVLYSFGKLFEFLSDRSHLPIVFLLAAVGGSALSLIFMPYGISVGASGGVLGIVSYLAVYAFRRRQFISPAFRNNMIFNIGFILLFGLLLFRYVDNYGHIGGLAVGGLYGLLQIPSDPYVDPRNGGRLAKTLGIASLAVFVLISLFAIYKMFASLG
ncbi:MAG TPA: rhomboid family intramembrane serine protease [Pyrinomonadaceae bacterium]|nr:rhomboid family intramembrane serine protease [Pyrinomonadaceae bacterium]HMP64179.1 rhomboid family intramembrane serine protease [Pyrinomonadaceae bacterium]